MGHTCVIMDTETLSTRNRTLMSQKHWWELNWNLWIPMDTTYNELFFYFWERQQFPEIETLYKLYLRKGHHILWKLALQSFNKRVEKCGPSHLHCWGDWICSAILCFWFICDVLLYCVCYLVFCFFCFCFLELARFGLGVGSINAMK